MQSVFLSEICEKTKQIVIVVGEILQKISEFFAFLVQSILRITFRNYSFEKMNSACFSIVSWSKKDIFIFKKK